ncbi:unnamed protein product [Rotaria sp. Silwood1]|nr:unnamed protein product [Rotaria sp. Silwood1]
MNEYEKAESYFQRLLQVLPVKHADRASIYDYMGTLNMRITNWKEALKNFNLAYEIKKKELHSNHRKIGRTLNGIGNYYKVIGDYFQAMIFYEKALQCQNDLCAKAVIQLNIGVIHSMNKDYDRALKFYFEARHILEQIHPCPHEEIAQCQAIIGNHYLTLKDYNTAEAYFHTTFEINNNDQKIQVLDKALSLLKKNMHIQYATTANCSFMIAEYCYKQTISEKAYDHAMRALEIRKKIYPDDHSILIETQGLIDAIKSLK